MPYQPGKRLSGEKASKIGHLDVLKSELVNKLMKAFQSTKPPKTITAPNIKNLQPRGNPLSIVFGIDGSLQIYQSDTRPQKRIAFVKTALLRIDQYALLKIDKHSPHPFALREILSDSALYHSTVFPLKHVSISGVNTYDAVRKIIFDSLQDPSLNGEPYETLKWIAYEKWSGKKKSIPKFLCPHCERVEASLKYDEDTGTCLSCKGDLFLSDMLSFHIDMAPDYARDTIATSYMNIHELLLLFTGIRYYWQNDKKLLSECLFVKDGPLYLRAHYSKLVNPIRRFLEFAKNEGFPIHLIGQEKTGNFADHLEVIEQDMKAKDIFIPNNDYINGEILQRPKRKDPYGYTSHYGAKTFVKIHDYHKMVLNIPTGNYIVDPKISDLIGIDRIMATLPTILSSRYEGALLPIELAHGIASLSTYPSAKILKIFSEAQGL